MKKRDKDIHVDIKGKNNGTNVGINQGILVNNFVCKNFDTLGMVEKLVYTYTDIFSYYLGKRFRNAHLNTNDSYLSDELKIIETCFISAFENRVKDNKNIVSEYCKKGIENINRVRNDYNIEDALCDGYLDYRKADFEFFQGYYLQKESRYLIICKAIIDYQSAAKKLGIELGVNEILLVSFNYTQDELKDKYIINAYMYNTFGECYSMLIQSISESELIISDKELYEIKMTAVNYCKKAVDYAQIGGCQREVYLRNYGVAIERAYPGDMNRLEQARELYRKSCILEDKSKKSYITYISVGLKIVFKLLDIPDKIIGEEREPKLIVQSDKIHSNYIANKERIDNIVKEMKIYIDTAICLAPNYVNVYTLVSKYNMLLGLLSSSMRVRKKLFEDAKCQVERALLLDNQYRGAIAINEDLDELMNTK